MDCKVCHEANKTYCHSIGDNSQLPWEEAAAWQRESAIKGVEYAIANPDAPASAQHEAWLKDKLADGWVYGEVKDAEQKTHPCCVPYEQLPVEQQKKDALFKAVVAALA
ncbi:RyR domain-containing protein [Paludisphaera mucosa]|uniref:RyR domain-containing protein n=1 Tax=Paludisphaera mucosa TaxID=3030827 RepID=UPI0034A1D826